MKIAIISDIHGNDTALKAVFAHIDAMGDVERIYCLGDVVGYGPAPETCIDLLRERCELTLMGNHDYALINSPIGFNPVAAGAIHWTRDRLEPGFLSMPKKQKRWEWINNLPERHWIGEDLLVHASPRDNIFEYVLPDDPSYAPDKIESIMDMIRRNVYIGHTHRPGIITSEPYFYTPTDLGMEYEFRAGEKLIINVSSVGQPRDHDPRACYVTVTEAGLTYHRVPYDIEDVVKRVMAEKNLDDYCGLRLRDGR